MGKSFEIIEIKTTNIKKSILEITAQANERASMAEDAYLSDFNDVDYHSPRGQLLGTTPKKIQKNRDTVYDLFEKANDSLVWYIYEIGQLGFVAYTIKCEIYEEYKKRKNTLILVYNGYKNKEFKNKTELLAFAKENDITKGKIKIISKGLSAIVGHIETVEKRYKTKPSILPKKYDYIKEEKLYLCGAWCRC